MIDKFNTSHSIINLPQESDIDKKINKNIGYILSNNNNIKTDTLSNYFTSYYNNISSSNFINESNTSRSDSNSIKSKKTPYSLKLYENKEKGNFKHLFKKNICKFNNILNIFLFYKTFNLKKHFFKIILLKGNYYSFAINLNSILYKIIFKKYIKKFFKDLSMFKIKTYCELKNKKMFGNFKFKQRFIYYIVYYLKNLYYKDIWVFFSNLIKYYIKKKKYTMFVESIFCIIKSSYIYKIYNKNCKNCNFIQKIKSKNILNVYKKHNINNVIKLYYFMYLKKVRIIKFNIKYKNIVCVKYIYRLIKLVLITKLKKFNYSLLQIFKKRIFINLIHIYNKKVKSLYSNNTNNIIIQPQTKCKNTNKLNFNTCDIIKKRRILFCNKDDSDYLENKYIYNTMYCLRMVNMKDNNFEQLNKTVYRHIFKKNPIDIVKNFKTCSINTKIIKKKYIFNNFLGRLNNNDLIISNINWAKSCNKYELSLENNTILNVYNFNNKYNNDNKNLEDITYYNEKDNYCNKSVKICNYNRYSDSSNSLTKESKKLDNYHNCSTIKQLFNKIKKTGLQKINSLANKNYKTNKLLRININSKYTNLWKSINHSNLLLKIFNIKNSKMQKNDSNFYNYSKIKGNNIYTTKICKMFKKLNKYNYNIKNHNNKYRNKLKLNIKYSETKNNELNLKQIGLKKNYNLYKIKQLISILTKLTIIKFFNKLKIKLYSLIYNNKYNYKKLSCKLLFKVYQRRKFFYYLKFFKRSKIIN